MAILRHGHSSANRVLLREGPRIAAAVFLMRSALLLMLSLALSLALSSPAMAQYTGPRLTGIRGFLRQISKAALEPRAA